VEAFKTANREEDCIFMMDDLNVCAGTEKIPFLQSMVVRASVTLDCAPVGLVSLLLGRRETSAKIPFGPYLALGALVWMCFGARLVAWCVGLMPP
jgi:hypothetical protein